jgi:hypothetical protein
MSIYLPPSFLFCLSAHTITLLCPVPTLLCLVASNSGFSIATITTFFLRHASKRMKKHRNKCGRPQCVEEADKIMPKLCQLTRPTKPTKPVRSTCPFCVFLWGV